MSWWVVEQAAGTAIEAALDAVVPRWLTTAWPFTSICYGVRPTG